MEDRGVGHAEGGHLELDESGNVTTGATDSESDDVGSVPDVLAGPDTPTWAKRLENAGITPFARRHRAVIATVMAIAVVAMAGTVFYVSTRPPPDDGVVAVTIESVPTGNGVVGGDLSVDGVMTMGYRLTPTRSSDIVRALGLVGPAVRASSVRTRTEAAAGQPVLVDVSVRLGCQDPRAVTARSDAYGLRIERTDAFGRTVIASVPATTLDEDLLGYFVQPCTSAMLREGLSAQSLRTAVDPQGRTVYLTIVVRSTLATDVSVEVNDFTTDRVLPVAVLPTGGPALIPRGGTGTIHVGLFVRDCSAPQLPDADERDGLTASSEPSRPGLSLSAIVPLSETDRTRGADMILAWPSGDHATIQSALNHLCQ